VNNDHLLDLFVVQSARTIGDRVAGPNQPDFLLIRRSYGFVKVTGPVLAGPTWGAGDSATILDYNGDGRTDLFVTNGFKPQGGPAQLLRNRSEGGNWVDVRLHYSSWNPGSIGSRVTLRAGRRTYRTQVTDGMNLASQSAPGILHFGIGRAAGARIFIRWPNGSTDCQTLEINSATDVSPTGGTCP
jgi:hypothetical protein